MEHLDCQTSMDGGSHLRGMVRHENKTRPTKPAGTFRAAAHASMIQPALAVREQDEIQPKLEIGQPDDEYEQEADQVADRVMMMSEADMPTPPDDDDKGPGNNFLSAKFQLQLKGSGPSEASPQFTARLHTTRSPGPIIVGSAVEWKFISRHSSKFDLAVVSSFT